MSRSQRADKEERSMMAPRFMARAVLFGPVVLLTFLVLIGEGQARAQPTFSEYDLPTGSGGPWGLCVGPDGNLWYATLDHPGGKIGRITPAGLIDEFVI